MNSVATQAISRSADPAGALKVVLVYEDFETGLTARHTLNGIVEAFEMEADFQINLWRFDLFADPAVRLEAVDEANNADLVLVSVRGYQELPAGARLWFEEWFARQRSHDPALVLLLDLDALRTPVADRMLGQLSASAKHAGVELFIHPGDAQVRWTSAVQDIHRRAETRTLLVDEMLDERPSFRHWGINE